ncbi:MAG: exodeoxyribonuclease V subunit gamma [Planctomycetota bacterium]|nr:exodeoxyribonuclease V subunit gamma [Planctomycetota bacterium]
MGRVILICGAIRTGKSAEIIQQFSECAGSTGQESLLILPTANQVEQTRIEIVRKRQKALWRPRILTFPEVATEILDSAEHTAPLISTVCERALMRLVLQRLQGWLVFFAPVSQYPGFVDSLCDFVGELKRAGVEPPEFEYKLKAADAYDTRAKELSRIYNDYQSLLHASDLYDIEGRFWMAREILQTKASFSFPDHFFVDGFENFTTTQLDMIQAIAAHAQQTKITLTFDKTDSRKKLFETTQRTFTQIQERFEPLELEHRSALPRPNMLGHLASQLFKDRPIQVNPTEQIQLIETPGRRREIESVARRIKKLLLGGEKPESIGVLFRSLSDYGDIVREVFAQAGVPVRAGQWMTADTQTVCRTILCMLRIVQNDFRFSEVIQFLNSNYVRFDPLESELTEGETFTPDYLAQIARSARIVGGADEWRNKLTALFNRDQAIIGRNAGQDDMSPSLEKRTRMARLGLQYIEAFIDEFALLPVQGTHHEYVVGIIDLVNRFKIANHLVDPLAPLASSANVRAFHQFSQCLLELRQVGVQLRVASGEPVKLTLDDFVRDLRIALGNSVFQAEGNRQGRVVVMEAHQARQMTFGHVFLCGLVEKGFPRPREEDIFFSDAERRKLMASGLMLEERLPQQRDEAMLFYGAACAADESLTLSYPVTNAEGREILTSYYVDEVRHCFEGTLSTRRVRLSEVVAERAEVFSAHEFRDRNFLDGRIGSTHEEESSAWQNAIWGAEAESKRESSEFNEFDGIMVSGAVRQELGLKFNENYPYSANQLSTMGTCQFQYFANYVLALIPPEDPGEEATPLDRGGAIHSILSRFFRAAGDPEHLGTTQITNENLPQASKLMDQMTGRFFAEQNSQGLVWDRALSRYEESYIKRHLQSFLEYEVSTNNEDMSAGRNFIPAEFELPFGWDEGDPAFINFGARRLRMRGMIDRVDISAADRKFRVWDYKLGRSSHPSNTLKGTDFQLPVYIKAAASSLNVLNCERCGYLAIQKPAKPSGVAYEEPPRSQVAVNEILEEADSRIPRLVEQVTGGEFAVMPADYAACSHCNYRDLCRVNPFRISRKTPYLGSEPRLPPNP